MRSLWLQVIAVTSINLGSIMQRRWLSLSTIVAIALVVIVLLTFLAMANGFQRTIAGSGADDIAMVLRAGSQAEINSTVSRDQVRLIEEGPGIARASDGKPLISSELYLVVDGVKRSTKTKANLPLRGIGEQGAALRKGIRVTAGRMFNRGANEIVVGKGLLKEFEGFELGRMVTFATSRWTRLRRTATIEVTDAQGDPVDADEVVVTPVMTEMGMTRPALVADELEPGRYRATGELFSMLGEWNLTVRVERAGVDDEATFTVDAKS